MPSLPDLPTSRFANRTRTSQSIPRRLVSERKFHLLPIYALLRTSDLAREGIENSGSFRFADHISRGKPSGRYGVGVLLDTVLLRLRGARSMRNRFLHSQRQLLSALLEPRDDYNISANALAPQTEPITVVSVPCGIARDLYQVAEILREYRPQDYGRVRFIGLDLDPKPLELSRNLTQGHSNFSFVCADALVPSSLPCGTEVIVSLGFGEFLDDATLVDFYGNCYGALRPGGRLITSAMSRDRISDYLARELAELHTHYRTAGQLIELLRSAGFEYVRIDRDDVGLQTLAVATK
jgi:SAM-dependent methyltransferase